MTCKVWKNLYQHVINLNKMFFNFPLLKLNLASLLLMQREVPEEINIAACKIARKNNVKTNRFGYRRCGYSPHE